jgi:hypothetical protein
MLESDTMNENMSTFVDSRAETLAREFLTRRPDVVVHAFEADDLDLICSIDPPKNVRIQGFMPFGVVITGTDKTIPTDQLASHMATTRWVDRLKKSGAKPHFFIPVILLMFSVTRDVGFYSWVSEPHFLQDGAPKLIVNEALDSARIHRNSLDRIVQVIQKWYSQMESTLILQR